MYARVTADLHSIARSCFDGAKHAMAAFLFSVAGEKPKREQDSQAMRAPVWRSFAKDKRPCGQDSQDSGYQQ
ncbi:hypothetical protein QOT17_003413 [Balamuthia mandrillaris]